MAGSTWRGRALPTKRSGWSALPGTIAAVHRDIPNGSSIQGHGTVLPAYRDREQHCKHCYIDGHLKGLVLWTQRIDGSERAHVIWVDEDMVVRQEFIDGRRVAIRSDD